MLDFLSAFGLLLVLEGLFFVVFPNFSRRVLSEAAQSPQERMRLIGIISSVLGIILLWIVRYK